MQRSRYSFRKVYEDFKKHYPELKYHTYYWHPYDFATIEIWLKDGKKYTYDDYTHQLKDMNERWREYEPDIKQPRGNKRKEISAMVAYNIVKLMSQYGMTQNTLARETGISQSAISKYICGRRLPNEDVLVDIARALGVEYHDLLKEE